MFVVVDNVVIVVIVVFVVVVFIVVLLVIVVAIVVLVIVIVIDEVFLFLFFPAVAAPVFRVKRNVPCSTMRSNLPEAGVDLASSSKLLLYRKTSRAFQVFSTEKKLIVSDNFV